MAHGQTILATANVLKSEREFFISKNKFYSFPYANMNVRPKERHVVICDLILSQKML